MSRCKARVVVRTKVDWTKMTPAAFAEQKDPALPGQVLSASRSDILDIWSRMFEVGFFEYRHLLQQIASESLDEHYGVLTERLRPQDLSPLLHERVRILQMPLSVHNKHVGSAGFFNKVLRRPNAEASFRSLDLATPIVLPQYAEWAERDLRRMEAILASAVT